MMDVYRLPLDYITMTICTWNTAMVGIIAIFWKSPLWLQQTYLIIISAATVNITTNKLNAIDFHPFI
jgi:presenilin 1